MQKGQINNLILIILSTEALLFLINTMIVVSWLLW